MTTEQIVSWVLSVLPSVIAVLTTVGLVIKTIKDFKQLKSDVANMTAMEEIRAQLKQVIEENIKLKKTLNQTMTKIDKVRRTDDAERTNKEV